MHASADIASGLHSLADFINTHNLGGCVSHLTVNIWCESAAEMAEVARTCAPLEKIYVGDYFVLRRSFGPMVRIEWNIARDQICERVVVGRREKHLPAQPAVPATTIVEDVVAWRCTDPLLARD